MKDIGRRVPVDRTAALVTSDGPKGVESSKKITQVHSETPLPMRPMPPDLPRLIGHTCGHLTVIGFYGHKRWVCRCVCGCYLTRSTKALRNPANHTDRCDRCRQVVHLRRESEWRELGYHPDEQ